MIDLIKLEDDLMELRDWLIEHKPRPIGDYDTSEWGRIDQAMLVVGDLRKEGYR